jgi:ribokinase
VRCAVVGHIEWVEFARVPRLPAAGDIVHAAESWAEPAGGGSVVARQLARLAGRCEFFTALGDDQIGRESTRRLAELGIDLHVRTATGVASRRAWTHVDAKGERTITLLSAKLHPHGPLPLEGYDVVFFTAGDVAALQSARKARFLAATPRESPTLCAAGVHLDLLVGSLNDPGEQVDSAVEATTIVQTDGAAGCIANGERFPSVPLPGPVVDTYGAGDSFAAALCFALARGDALPAAIELASRAGASVITGQGPYTTQLELVDR